MKNTRFSLFIGWRQVQMPAHKIYLSSERHANADFWSNMNKAEIPLQAYVR